jgi:hypothetical protein
MKSPIRSSAVAAALLAVALGTNTQAASSAATTPTTPGLVSPAPERTYPSPLPLRLQVTADEAHELRTLREFTITAQGEDEYAPTIVIGPVDPFTSENTCARPMPQGIAGCVVNGDGTLATLQVNWQVPRAGVYRFVLSGKRGTSDRVVTIGAFDLDALD